MDGCKTIALAGLTGLVGALVAACGHVRHAAPATKASSEATVALFHDGARVRQPVTIRATGTTAQRISMVVPAGVDPSNVKLVDLGDVQASIVEGSMEEDAPSRVAFDVVAKRPGTYRAILEYVMPTLQWSATYTLTTTPAHEDVTVRGAIGLSNKSGAPLSHVHVSFVDGAMIDVPPEDCSVRPCKKLSPLDLGTRDIPAGDSRLELLANEPTRAMTDVLVYDPIGTRLDEANPSTNTDPELGLHIPPSSTVVENYEIARPASQPEGLPKGPARLFERGRDGQLTLLAESDLFGWETLKATSDTFAIRAVKDVVGARERRDFSYDRDEHRTVEEIGITLTNQRTSPVDVVVREHAYRGLNWAAAYMSVARFEPEGRQRFKMRVKLPAHGQTRIVYVVVYTEPP